MAGRFPFYLLSDSPEGAEREAQQTGVTRRTDGFAFGIRRGFVYQRIWPYHTQKYRQQSRHTRRARRSAILSAVTKYGDSEVLYDKPFTDNKRVRVTGPFTVESLSPHRTISAAEKKSRSESFGDGRTLKVIGPDKFGLMIIENLHKAGVQNTKKNERLVFDSIEPHAGEWIHAEGRYTEGDDTEKRAAICIGPEHGTVGPELVKEAAKEAVRGVGFDMLIVCGFALDEDAWSQLYSTTSRPFPKPETGKIAVKVINHYGDEVLNVYSV